MNRPFQAKFAESLMEIVAVKTAASARKCLRQREIIKSNDTCSSECNLQQHFVNPFSEHLDHNQLYNLVSGFPVEEDVSNCLVGARGKLLMIISKEG